MPAWGKRSNRKKQTQRRRGAQDRGTSPFGARSGSELKVRMRPQRKGGAAREGGGKNGIRVTIKRSVSAVLSRAKSRKSARPRPACTQRIIRKPNEEEEKEKSQIAGKKKGGPAADSMGRVRIKSDPAPQRKGPSTKLIPDEGPMRMRQWDEARSQGGMKI